MPDSILLQQLATKEATAETITDQVIRSPELLPEIFEGLKEEKANIKYGCLKVQRLISEQQPALLYPRFDFFVDLLDSEVTFFKWGANIIGSSAKIAPAKPELTERITREILKVQRAVYQTDECRNLAIGHAIKSFHQIFDQIKNKEPVIKFIKKQLDNTRSGTKKAAEKFVRTYGI
jgi:hypothetical protein